MRKVLLFLAILFAGASSSFAQLTGTKTIGSGGDYATIEAAIAALNTSGTAAPGVTFLIASGTYTPAAALSITTTTGSATAPIEFRPAAGATVVVNVSSNGGAAWGIAANAGYITINGSNTGGGTDRSMTINNTYVGIGIGIKGFGTNVSCAFKNLVVTTGASTAAQKIDAASRGIDVFYGGTAESNNFLVDNCAVDNAGVGIRVEGNATTPSLSGVIVRNNTVTNTGLYGIYCIYNISIQVYNNDVQTPNGTGTTVWGIALSTSVTGNFKVYNNKVHNVKSSTTGTATAASSVAGIYLSSTSTNFSRAGNIYNNFVYDINATAATGSIAVYGIHCIATSANTAPDSVVHNSVSLTGTNTPSRVSAALAFNATTSGNKLYVRNNIFANTMTSGTAASIAILKSTASTTLNADNNDLYVGTVSTTKLTGRIGTTDYQTIANWRTGSGQDAVSVVESPAFTSATDLHIPNGTSTVLESAGSTVAITGITADIDGQQRPGPTAANGGGTAPDLGADEFDGAPIDAIPPAITYTALANTCATGNIILSGVAITDVSGVPTSGSLVPRIYYKKSSTGSYYSNAGTLSSGTATNGQWSFTINVADLGGVVGGDSIFYYVIAQDVAGTPNISSNPSGAVATNVNTVTTPPSSPNSFAIGAILSGTYTVGANGIYSSLTAAAAAYNTGCLTGPVTFSLLDALYNETIVINSNPSASSTNTLLIKPAAGVTTTISTSSASAVIKLNGADYVIIDGSNSATANSICPQTKASRNLTISNTNTGTSSAVIWLGSASATNGATNNIIRNSIITGNAATTTGYGVFAGSGTTIGSASLALNSSNLVQNNFFSKSAQGVLFYGASTAAPDVANEVSLNDFGSATAGDGFSVIAIGGQFQDGMKVLGNNVQNITYSGTSTNVFGIGLFDSKNAVVDKNKVRNLSYTGSSTIKIYAIHTATTTFNSSTNPSANTFTNNFVYGLSSTATSASWNTSGINNNGGYGDKYYFNTVYLNGQMSGSGGTAGSAAFSNGNGITNTNCGGIDVRNNIFHMAGSSPAAAPLYAHYTTLTANTGLTLNYNDLYATASGSASAKLGRYNATDYTTLAAWQTATGEGSGSISVEPGYVSATDLHLGAAAAAMNNAGTPIAGITTDIDCETRNASTPDIGADEFTPVSLDIVATGLVNPALTGCYSASNVVTVAIKNNGTAAIDFSANPSVVKVAVSGAVTASLSKTVNTGTLAAGATLNVDMSSTLDMTTAGTYTFNANATTTGDGVTANDTMQAVTRTVVGNAILPQIVSFNGYTGTPASLSSNFPGWTEGTGIASPVIDGDGSFTSSSTSQTPFYGQAAKLNLYNSNNGWIISPKFLVTGTTRFNYGAALVNYNATTAATFGSSDSVKAMISLDCGISWQSLREFNSTNPQGLGTDNTIRYFSDNLSAYAGQQAYVAMYARRAVSSTSPDIDILVDSFEIKDATVTPVTLVSFRGEKAGRTNKLQWQTANEQNNAGFELQRSANGTSFSTIGQVASRAVNGSSTAPLQYGFDDVQPLNGANYYRLKQLDKDGRYTYSATVLLKGEKVTSVQLGVVYPNPVTSVLQFSVAAPANRKVTFVVTDLSGRIMLSSLQQLTEGDNMVQLPVSKLAAGTYLLKAVCAEGCETTTAKFIKL